VTFAIDIDKFVKASDLTRVEFEERMDAELQRARCKDCFRLILENVVAAVIWQRIEEKLGEKEKRLQDAAAPTPEVRE